MVYEIYTVLQKYTETKTQLSKTPSVVTRNPHYFHFSSVSYHFLQIILENVYVVFSLYNNTEIKFSSFC